MHTQTNSSNNTPTFVRRIPRGGSAKGDPISRLERQAAAHHRHIRGMKQRVRNNDDRRALEAARLRLVEVLRIIAERPEEVNTGTHNTIAEAIAEARAIYANAKKAGSCRRGKRPPQEKGVRPKNAGEYTNEEDESEAATIVRPANSSADPKADEFADEHAAMYTYR